MLLWDTDWEKPPLKGEGNRRQAVEGFCGIFYAMCKIYEVTPQSSLRLASSPKGEPITNQPPL